MRDRALARSVTRSVDAPPALAPVLAELFTGIDALGSMPRITVRELARAGVGPRSRLLDLACGKGAVAVEAARRIGCRVHAVDACPAFIEFARSLARRRCVAERCRFTIGDVESRPRERYDAAMMIGLLPLPRAARVLRHAMRRGGVYIIDDCWWDDRLADPPNADCFTREQSRAIIQKLGDRVERIVTPTPTAIRTLNDRLFAAIKANVRAVERTHPRLRVPLRTFLDNQRAANRLLGDVLRPALWVVRRS